MRLNKKHLRRLIIEEVGNLINEGPAPSGKLSAIQRNALDLHNSLLALAKEIEGGSHVELSRDAAGIKSAAKFVMRIVNAINNPEKTPTPFGDKFLF